MSKAESVLLRQISHHLAGKFCRGLEEVKTLVGVKISECGGDPLSRFYAVTDQCAHSFFTKITNFNEADLLKSVILIIFCSFLIRLYK